MLIDTCGQLVWYRVVGGWYQQLKVRTDSILTDVTLIVLPTPASRPHPCFLILILPGSIPPSQRYFLPYTLHKPLAASLPCLQQSHHLHPYPRSVHRGGSRRQIEVFWQYNPNLKQRHPLNNSRQITSHTNRAASQASGVPHKWSTIRWRCLHGDAGSTLPSPHQPDEMIAAGDGHHLPTHTHVAFSIPSQSSFYYFPCTSTPSHFSADVHATSIGLEANTEVGRFGQVIQ
jgi:hypothetical protein